MSEAHRTPPPSTAAQTGARLETIAGMPEPPPSLMREEVALLHGRIAELEGRLIEGPLPGGELVRHLARYRELFEQAPVSLWEEDWSAVKTAIEDLRAAGVQDFKAYFTNDTEALSRLAWSAEVVDFNQATAEIYRAPSKEAFWAMAIHDFLTIDEMSMFCDTLDAFARGKIKCTVEGWEKTFDGENIYIRDTVYIPSEFRHDWARIVHTVEDVTEQKRAEMEARQLEKFQTVGLIAGGLAHDLNNVLMSAGSNLEMLGALLPPGREREVAEEGFRVLTRGGDLIRKLLAFAQRHPQRPRPVDLDAVLKELTPVIERMLGEDIAVEIDRGEGEHWARVDPTLAESAILNLVLNARDAMAQGGRLRVSLKAATLDAATLRENPHLGARTFVALRVSDTGVGMPAAVAVRAIEPFFTTKESGRGMGLGLSMIYGFVKQAGGHLAIESAPGQGTSVDLYLPRTEAGSGSRTCVIETGDEIPTGDETILVVGPQDDADRSALAALLEGLGYRVVRASNNDSALGLLDDEAERIDLLITDIVMPGERNGRMLAREARIIRPALKVLYTSVHPGEPLVEGTAWDADTNFIARPFKRGYLARRIRHALDH